MSLIGGDPVIHSLCLEQMAPWLGAPVSRDRAEEVYHTLNATVRSVFLYRISDGDVVRLDKPGFRLRDKFNDSGEPEPEGPIIYLEEFIRANMYRELLKRLLAGGSSIDMMVAIDVNDSPIGQAEAPVFAFQKPRGGNTVLFPDVDFLHANFYLPPEYHDSIPYKDKIARAVFAGSTTGGRTIKARDVRKLTLPRLLSGVHFKGSDLVDFRLPRIVQCESPAVAQMVAALGVNNKPASWQEQFQYRFLLSMDGNGATCSRVAIGLLSQSVLVKYDSPQLLYYFGALVPWRHFVPVGEDEEVELIVAAERSHPMIFQSVADEGRSFARRYLGRIGICVYGSALLRLAQSCIAEPSRRGSGEEKESEDLSSGSLPLVELGAHIQGIGDVWGWPGEWVGEGGSGRAVEAIALMTSAIPIEAIAVSIVLADGSVVAAPQDRGFYGTRGQDRPLHGFELRFSAPWAERLQCSYSGRFIDGITVGPLAPGEVCRSPSGAALESV